MPFLTDRYLPTLNAAVLQKPIGKPDLIPKLPDVQEEFRKVFEFLYKLEGRLGDILLLDDVTINGGLTISGRLTLESLTVVASAAPAVSALGTATLYFDSTSNTLKISQNGSPYVDV